MLSSHLAVEESVFETLRIKRYGRLCVLLTPDMKIMSYEFNMLGHDFSIPQPVILNQLGAMMQELQFQQQAMSQAAPTKLQKPHEVLDLALNAIANLGHGLEGEVSFHQQLYRCQHAQLCMQCALANAAHPAQLPSSTVIGRLWSE